MTVGGVPSCNCRVGWTKYQINSCLEQLNTEILNSFKDPVYRHSESPGIFTSTPGFEGIFVALEARKAFFVCPCFYHKPQFQTPLLLSSHYHLSLSARLPRVFRIFSTSDASFGSNTRPYHCSDPHWPK
jgi:hypothetical protein